MRRRGLCRSSAWCLGTESRRSSRRGWCAPLRGVASLVEVHREVRGEVREEGFGHRGPGTPYVGNNFRAKMSEIRSMAPKWIWCASKLSRALDAKATSRSRAGGCWPAVERTSMPHSTATARTHAQSNHAQAVSVPGQPLAHIRSSRSAPLRCTNSGSCTKLTNTSGAADMAAVAA